MNKLQQATTIDTAAEKPNQGHDEDLIDFDGQNDPSNPLN